MKHVFRMAYSLTLTAFIYYLVKLNFIFDNVDLELFYSVKMVMCAMVFYLLSIVERWYNR